jgi:hypothetical protein
MKRIHWTLLLLFCALGMVLLLAMPPMDAPDTAFNEMDLPLTVSHARLPRITFMRPATQAMFSTKFEHEESLDSNHRPARRESVTKSQQLRSLQPLLCTFLI